MKYILPLMLVTSAALAAARQTPFDLAALWPEPAPPPAPLHVEPPWLRGVWEDSSPVTHAEPHAGGYGEGDPHAGLYGASDRHVGLYGEADPHAGLHAGVEIVGTACPRDGDVEADGYGSVESATGSADPHAGLHASELPSGVPVNSHSVPRSTLANGHTVAEIFAERTSLRARPVAVRGIVVKRTDGVLGKTYLHLRDGSGSPERRDLDLTVTTDGEFQVGEVVEVEGQLVVDQDLGLGYRYATLLESAHRVRPR